MELKRNKKTKYHRYLFNKIIDKAEPQLIRLMNNSVEELTRIYLEYI